MIKGTKSNCIVSDIKISKSKAYITLIVSSSELNNPSIPFNIYIKDYDLDNFDMYRQMILQDSLKDDLGTYFKLSSVSEVLYTETKISNITYWLDVLYSYSDNLNVSINKYKQIILEIDITNQNLASIISQRFVRLIHFKFVNPQTNKTIWNSENILLVSNKIELPTISHLQFTTDNNYNIACKFKYNYQSDIDYNYNNKHLFTEIVVKSPQTLEVLESLKIEEEHSEHSTVEFKLNNVYTETIIINILLKNYYGSDKVVDKWLTNDSYTEKLVGGTVMATYTYYYTPKPKVSDMYIKVNNTVMKVVELYSKPKEESNGKISKE
jgi:hypothetical protein